MIKSLKTRITLEREREREVYLEDRKNVGDTFYCDEKKARNLNGYLVLIVLICIALCILIFSNKTQTKSYGAIKTNYLVDTVEKTKSDTIKFNLIGTDDSTKVTSSLKLSDITIIVGTTTLSQSDITSIALGEISYPETNRATCQLTLKGVPGEGQLKIKIAGGTLTDRAGNTNSEATLTTEVTIVKETLKIASNAAIGDYVAYNISYTDVYTGYGFTKADGWRLVKKTDNGNGTADIEIISTGVPAKLYYHYNSGDMGNANNGWWGTAAQVSSLYGSTYANAGYDYNNSGYPNYFAATGMYLNFENIKFAKGTSASANYGCYTNINGITSGDLYGSAFKTEEASGVRIMSLAELNIARGLGETSTTSTATTDADTGLFYLRNLANENSSFGYTSSTSSYYWLASPLTGNRNGVRLVDDGGDISNGTTSTFGVRPLVSISGVKMQ